MAGKTGSISQPQDGVQEYVSVAFRRVLQVALLIGQLALVLLVIVVPLVMLARHQRLLFWILALGLIGALVRFLLKRKYLNMVKLDRSDTRAAVRRRSVKLRFLYRILLRPLLFLLAGLCYLVFLHSLTFPGAPRVFGLLGAFALTFFLVAWVRYLRRTPGAPPGAPLPQERAKPQARPAGRGTRPVRKPAARPAARHAAAGRTRPATKTRRPPPGA